MVNLLKNIIHALKLVEKLELVEVIYIQYVLEKEIVLVDLNGDMIEIKDKHYTNK